MITSSFLETQSIKLMSFCFDHTDLRTKVMLWPSNVDHCDIKVSLWLTVKHTMHTHQHSNSHYCTQSKATFCIWIYVLISGFIILIWIQTESLYHNLCRCVKWDNSEYAWLTCIWGVPINVLAEVEDKLGVVEWQLQLFAVSPEGTVLISFNITPLFSTVTVQ